MNAEIVAVGTEILLGHIVNTNSAFLSKRLASLGIHCYYHTTVGDNPARLSATIRSALTRADIVITTGGLGPTVDDITMQAVSDASSRKLIFNEGVFQTITAYFRRKGIRRVPRVARKMAFIPEGARCFTNYVGTAPGVILALKKKLIIALPGPPRELEPLFDQAVTGYLKNASIVTRTIIKTRTIKTIGIVEGRVNTRVRDLLELSGTTTVGIYAKLGYVELKITSRADSSKKADALISRVEKVICKRLGDAVFGFDDDTLEGAVGSLLLKKKRTIAVAESCTGGLLLHRITNVSGSTRYLLMGCVAYSNAAKQRVLGVSAAVLKAHGAVSDAVVREMAKGIRAVSGADIGVAITGIAGPTGGTKTKPVGLVYIAVSQRNGTRVKVHRFRGTRQGIKQQSAQAALALVRTVI